MLAGEYFIDKWQWQSAKADVDVGDTIGRWVRMIAGMQCARSSINATTRQIGSMVVIISIGVCIIRYLGLMNGD
jgi:hypothetical protein